MDAVHTYRDIRVRGRRLQQQRQLLVSCVGNNELNVEKKKNKPKWYKAFRQKWNKNYLPQVAMYSQACQCDVMFILLIARNTAEFTIIPVSGDEKYLVLRNKWERWVRDSTVTDKVAKYREQKSVEV